MRSSQSSVWNSTNRNAVHQSCGSTCNFILPKSRSETFYAGESPDQLDAQLYLPRWRRRRHNLPGAIDRRSLCIEEGPMLQRRSQVGMVEDVEDLRAQLQLQPLLHAAEGIVLEERHVERL